MRTRVLLIAVAAGALTWSGPAWAQEEHSDELLTVAHYLDFERVGDPQISPDGSQVIYTRSWVDKMKDSFASAIWIMDADGSRNRFLTEGGDAQWSPDGTRIAYLAEGEPGGAQVFVRWMDAEGATSQITHETQSPSNLKWSPDGTWVYFQRVVPHATPWPIDMPSPPEGAEWTAAPTIVDRIHYRFDRIGFLPDGFNHLFRVPADGGTGQQLTEGEWHAGASFVAGVGGAGYDLTPDGRTLVFDGLVGQDADGLYRESHIWAMDLETRETRQLTQTRGPWASPHVSPNGRHIAYTGYPWTPQTYKTTELYVMGVDGSNRRLVSGELDRDVGGLNWAGDSQGVYFTAGDQGTSNVHYASTSGSLRHVTRGTHMLSLTSVSDDGTAVGTRTSPLEPADIVRYSLADGDVDQLTHVNADVLAGKRLGAVEEIWAESSGGARVQGWIVKPPDFEESEEYPLILHIHGGPHGMYNVGFSNTYQNYAANGYVVLYTNPRGSTGYGTDFGNAIDNGYPSVDFDDLMASTEALVDRGYIDENRMYVTGCSGGGVLSSWVIGHSDRFAAAGVRCPVINWMSFAGTADIAVWGYYRYEGYPWNNPDKYLEHSPLMYVENVTTPTILMTGELDLRTPMGQTEEYYQALKQVGVPTKMLRFKGEYHGTSSKPSNWMRTQLYLMKWFEQYAKDRPITDGA